MSRRRAFTAAAAVLGLPLGEAAARLGVTSHHLMQVLTGTRRGSTQLEAGIRAVLDEAKAELRAIADGAYDAPAECAAPRTPPHAPA